LHSQNTQQFIANNLQCFYIQFKNLTGLNRRRYLPLRLPVLKGLAVVKQDAVTCKIENTVFLAKKEVANGIG
jgi:hypothetical protein